MLGFMLFIAYIEADEILNLKNQALFTKIRESKLTVTYNKYSWTNTFFDSRNFLKNVLNILDT